MKILPKKRSHQVRFLILISIMGGLLLYFFILPYIYYVQYEPESGDIVFQSLPNVSDLVKAIEGVTGSPYSHCGVVVYKDRKWQVIEAIGNVHYTDLYIWIRRGRWSKFSAFRLNDKYKKEIDKFIESMEEFLGRPYDFRYRLDDEYIYCSELVYKGFKTATGEELGSLVELKDLNWEPYTETINKYEGSDTIPLDREIITPRDLAKAEQIKEIYNNGM